MINTELELMQASNDAELEAAEQLQKFMVEWMGKRGQPKAQPQMPMQPQKAGLNGNQSLYEVQGY